MQQVFNRFIEKFHYFSWLATFTSRSLAHKFCHMKFLKVLPSFSKFAHKTRAERPFVLVSVSEASDARKSGLTYILPLEAAEHTFQLRFRLRFDSDSDTPVLPFCRILWPYYSGCLLLGSVLSVECRVPRNRILCKYPNQIHILKFNCFIRKFYLRGKARREQRRCLGRVLQTQPLAPCCCQSCRPFLIYFHLKNQVQSAKTGKRRPRA